MNQRTIENDVLSIEDKVNASRLAKRMIQKHGYWTALYHCMTLAIHCRRKDVHDWSDDELRDITFWWEVRNLIYKSR